MRVYPTQSTGQQLAPSVRKPGFGAQPIQLNDNQEALVAAVRARDARKVHHALCRIAEDLTGSTYGLREAQDLRTKVDRFMAGLQTNTLPALMIDLPSDTISKLVLGILFLREAPGKTPSCRLTYVDGHAHKRLTWAWQEKGYTEALCPL